MKEGEERIAHVRKHYGEICDEYFTGESLTVDRSFDERAMENYRQGLIESLVQKLYLPGVMEHHQMSIELSFIKCFYLLFYCFNHSQ